MMKKFEDILLFLLGWFHQEPFIKNEEDGVCILGHYLAISTIIPCCLKVDEQIRKAHIFGVVVVFTGLHSECTCHVAFTATCGTGYKDVPVISDILTAGKSLNQILVKLASGCVIYICDAGRWLVKLGILYNPKVV